MKKLTGSLILAILLFNCSNSGTNEPSQVVASDDENTFIIKSQAEPDTLKGSLKARASNNVNGVNITIFYSSPAVRGRSIWGSLVPMNRIWVSGAHMATSIEITDAVQCSGVIIPKGKYGLFTIPGAETWTVIINKNWQQHLTDMYNEKDDLLRMQVKPEQMETHQERLRYEVDQTGEGRFSIVLSWEKVRIQIPFELDR